MDTMTEFTAEEARELTLKAIRECVTTWRYRRLQKRAFKRIARATAGGYYAVDCSLGFSNKAEQIQLLSKLKLLGYKVDKDRYDDSLSISWQANV